MPERNTNADIPKPRPEEHRSADLEILGQKLNYPNSIPKLISFFLFLLAIVFLLYHIMDRNYSFTHNKDGFSFSVVEKKANILNGYTIGFWTPSDSTKKGLINLSKEDSLEYKWQIKCEPEADFEKANQAFGKRLKQRFGFVGYRRCKVFGEGGNGKFKEGWWWSIGSQGKCDENFLKELKECYTDFWLPKDKGKDWDNLYVEIIGTTDK